MFSVIFIKDIKVVILIFRINKSTSPNTPPSPTTPTSPVKGNESTVIAKTSPSPVTNEDTPLLDSRKSYEKLPSDNEEEQITFADIPMPGLWEEDKPGRNTDRIIILLLALLASMIVVSIGWCTTLVLFCTNNSIDVLPSKSQALCEYCTHVSRLKHC